MKKRILIVDDQTDYTLLRRALTEYEIALENDSTRALAVAMEFRPDLFVLDLVMPDVHGTVLAEQIRREEIFRNTPIIFISALVHSKRNDTKVVRIGEYSALGKPFSVDELKKCISEEIEGAISATPIPKGILAGS